MEAEKAKYFRKNFNFSFFFEGKKGKPTRNSRSNRKNRKKRPAGDFVFLSLQKKIIFKRLHNIWKATNSSNDFFADREKNVRLKMCRSQTQTGKGVEMIAVVEDVLSAVGLPAGVVGFVCGVADADLTLQFTQVTPRLIVLQPNVRQRLVHCVPLALLHLQQVGYQVDGCNKIKEKSINL